MLESFSLELYLDSYKCVGAVYRFVCIVQNADVYTWNIILCVQLVDCSTAAVS